MFTNDRVYKLRILTRLHNQIIHHVSVPKRFWNRTNYNELSKALECLHLGLDQCLLFF